MSYIRVFLSTNQYIWEKESMKMNPTNPVKHLFTQQLLRVCALMTNKPVFKELC